MVTARASAGTLTDALTASVGFFAVTDARPTRERQGGRCVNVEHHSTIRGKSDHEMGCRPSVGVKAACEL